MKKILTLTMTALLCGVMGMQAQSASALRVYINAGHGSWGPNDRPMPIIREVNGVMTQIDPNTSTANTSYPDTTAFYESNTNLRKAFGLFEGLKQMGLKFDATKNQTNSDATRVGAGLDMSNNIVFSHVKAGPYPMKKISTSGSYQGDQHYNRSLSEVAVEVEQNNFDMFVSIHSNAATEGSATNAPLILYRGPDYSKISTATTADQAQIRKSYSMSEKAWPYYVADTNNGWSKTTSNIRGDWNFYPSHSVSTNNCDGYLGVLKHHVPGYLAEGYHHTYQPARQRHMNWDVDYIEGYGYAMGIADYFGLSKPNTGNIYGIVRDQNRQLSHSIYNPNESTQDIYLPLNGATVTLKRNGAVVATYTTDNHYNGAYVFKNLAPGAYTVTVSHPNYTTVNTTSVTVTAGATACPAQLYINGAGSYTEQQVEISDASFDFVNDYKDLQIEAFAGKKIRRVIAADKDNYYILAHDANDVPSLYRYQSLNRYAAPISITGIDDKHPKAANTTTEYSNKTTRDVADIALTSDGYLVAVNAGTADHNGSTGGGSDTSTKLIYAYYWAKDGSGYATGNPISMGSTASSGNMYNASFGKTMTYTGTLASGKIHVMLRNDYLTNPTHSLRVESLSISNATIGTTVRTNWDGVTTYKTDEIMGDTQFAPSHLSNVDIFVTSQNVAPMGVVLATSNGGSPTFSQKMAAGNFSGYYGFRSSYSQCGNKWYMVAPMDANATSLKIFNVTNGLASAANVTTTGLTPGTVPSSVRQKAVSWIEADQGVAHVSSHIDTSDPEHPRFHVLVVRGNGLVSHYVNQYDDDMVYNPSETTSFDFDQDFIDRPVTDFAGLNIRRMIPRFDDEFYVLGFDSNDAPHIFMYNVRTNKITKTVVLPTDNNSGNSHIRDIADIALTDDNRLVAISAENVPYNGEGLYKYIHLWYWENGSAGRANGNPISAGTTNFQGYWNNGYCGKTMAFEGTLSDGYLYYPSITNGTSTEVRWIKAKVSNYEIKSQFVGYPIANMGTDNIVRDFQISPSPWNKGRFLLTTQTQNPREVEFTGTDRTACVVTASLPGGYISTHKGFRGSIMKVGERIYFISPEDDNASEIKILDVTRGLSNPVLVNASGTELGTIRSSAMKKVPWIEANQGVASVCGIANATNPDYPTINIFAVRGNGLVSHLTNFYSPDDPIDQDPFSSNIDFNQNFADNSVKPVTGKNVRRIVANDKACYVLAYNQDDDGRYTQPVIAAYDIHRQRVVANLSIPENNSDYRNIGDIALTDDGYLVAVNADLQQFSDDTNDVPSNVHFYYWNKNAQGISSGNPIGMGAMDHAGNWQDADFGCTMTYRGSLDNGTFYVFNTNNAASSTTSTGHKADVRFNIVPVSSKRINANNYSYNKMPTGYDDETMGDYQVITSPLHSDGIILTCERMLPFELKVNATTAGTATIYSTLPADLVTDNGFRADVFKAGSRCYLVEPQSLTSGSNNGLNLIDVTDGLASAKNVTSNTLLTPTKAPRQKMPWVEVGEGVPMAVGYATNDGSATYLNLCLVRSAGMLSHFSTDPNFELDTSTDGPSQFAYELAYSPYSSDEYVLNFNATGAAEDGGRVVLTNIDDPNDEITLPISSIDEGNNIVHVDYTELAKDAYYKWEVQVDNQPVASSQLIAQTTLEGLESSTRGGVVVITDPQSPSYGKTIVAYGRAGGIEVYDPDHQYLGTYHANAATMNATNASSLFRGAERNGKAVFVDWSDSGAGYWQFDPENPEAPLVNLLEGTKDSKGAYTYNGNVIGGGATGIAFVGSGADEKCYVYCEDYPSGNVANGASGGSNGNLIRYDIAGAETFTQAPSIVTAINPSGYNLHWYSTCVDLYAIDEGVFISQYRGSSNARNEPGFVFADHSGNVLFNSADLVEFESAGIGAGLALSLDKKTFAISNGSTGIIIYNVEWNDGVPSFSYRNTIETEWVNKSFGAHIQMRFDPAGNLAVFNNSIGYQLYSVPNEETVAVTPAPSYSLVNRAIITGVEDVLNGDGDGDAPVEYFNTQGIRITNPAKGQVVIRRQGKRTAKIVYK